MKVKRYKIKNDTIIKDLLKYGAKETKDCLFIDKYVTVRNSEIKIHLIFKQDIEKWNDVDGVEVIDTDAGHEYQPFYKYRNSGDEVTGSKFIEGMIADYNEFMGSLPFMKEI